MRIGLLGASRIAPKSILQPAQETGLAEVVSVASRDRDRAQMFACAHDIPNFDDGYEALLEREDIDLVYIALPPALHHEWILKSLEAGKSVLCEKPFVVSLDQARSVLSRVARSSLFVIEGYHYRHHQAFKRAERIIESGSLGAIVGAHAWFFNQVPPDEGEYRFNCALGGGALFDLGGYCVHALRTLLKTEPKVVSARSKFFNGVDSATIATLRFGTCFAQISCNLMASAYEAEILLHCENGDLLLRSFVSPPKAGTIQIDHLDGTREIIDVPGISTYAAQLHYVADMMAGSEQQMAEMVDSSHQMGAIWSIRQKM